MYVRPGYGTRAGANLDPNPGGAPVFAVQRQYMGIADIRDPFWRVLRDQAPTLESSPFLSETPVYPRLKT